MGSNHSKATAHASVALVLPRSWAELEQFYLRFQQDARRRAADPHARLFLAFPAFEAILAPRSAALGLGSDKTQLLAAFNALDRKQRRRLAAMDFFSGLALVVEGKKAAKFEFIVSLLDNGGSKTLNKCELTMVLMAAARGLAMFKRTPEAREELMKVLVKRLMGEAKEVLRDHIVDKAMADAEIVFVMNDLGSETATTADGLLTQQAKLMQAMGDVDYQFARVTFADDGSNRAQQDELALAQVLQSAAGTATRTKPIASFEVLARKLQNAVCPPQSEDKALPGLILSDNQVAVTGKPTEVRKRVDGRSVQRLVTHISDGRLSISTSQANSLAARMAKDQLGLVKCSEIVRVVKAWLRDARKDSSAYWEVVAGTGIQVLQSVKHGMERALLLLEPSARTIRILPESVKLATQLSESNQEEPDRHHERSDPDLHFNLRVRVGPSEVLQSDGSETSAGASNVKFRLEVHTAEGDESSPLLVSQDQSSNSDEMTAVVDLDEEAMDLAFAVEAFLSDEQRLRVRLTFNDDFFVGFQLINGFDVSEIIRSLLLVGELDKTLHEYVDAWLALEEKISNLAAQENRESILRHVFMRFDVDRDGVLNLQEFNGLQQALHKCALDDASFQAIFPGASALSFAQFAASYEPCSAADIAEFARQLGLGSINDSVKGKTTLTCVLFEPSVRAVEHLLSPLRWGDRIMKKLLVFCRSTNDLSYDLQFPTLTSFLQHFAVDSSSSSSWALARYLTDPAFPIQTLRLLQELLSPPHTKHATDEPCRSLFCSIGEVVSKTPQQLEADDLSRGLPVGTTAKQAKVLRKAFDAAALLHTNVETLELVGQAPAPTSDSTPLVLQDAEARRLFDTAVQARQDGDYSAAIAGFERAIEIEDSEVVWGELALAQFQLWHSYSTALHKEAILALSIDPKTGHRSVLSSVLLQEAYNTFIIAMEYPVNKKNPMLLLKLVHLYMEYAAFRGALSVCTLLVEAYAHCKQVNEAIFMSAVTAKALGKHHESAQYLSYLVDKPPHRLSAYQLHLLAAREFELVPGMQDHAREAYAEAYRAMIALAPISRSEKTAHEVYTSSRKNESIRVQLWFQDDAVWFDLATRMASINAPLLVLAALDVNAAMAAQDERVIATHLNASARTIQTLHLIFLAKRERRIREALRERHATILRDFAVQRAVMGRRHVVQTWALFVQIQRRERGDAAMVVQRCVRAYSTRKMVRRLLKRRRHQERVIEMCVGRKAASTKHVMLVEWKAASDAIRRTKFQAATRIQSFYRSRLARRRYRAALRRHKLTLDLMGRMVFDRDRRFLARSWTALSSNALWHRLQKRKSAILIQRRRNVDMNVQRRSECANSIQRVYRGFRARKRVRIMRECQRMLASADLTFKHRSRDFVLRLCFLLLVRFPEQAADERLRSAVTIQRSWRHRRLMRRLRAALAKITKRRAIMARLNASFWALAQLFFVEAKKLVLARRWRRNRAARKLQRAWRTYITRRHYARVVEQKALAHEHALRLERTKRNLWLASVLRAWHTALINEKLERHRAAARIQCAFRAKLAQRQASKIVAKKAAQARLLASVGQKPLERCFRRWEAVLIDKCVVSVRSALKSPVVRRDDDKRRLALKLESRLSPVSNALDSRTLEQRAEVPSLLFYALLNRVRKSGICQLSNSAGSSFSSLQLRQLLELSSSVVCDGGGTSGPGHLLEQFVDSMRSSSSRVPAQKLILLNAALDIVRVARLSQLLSASDSCLLSLVLGNIPLRAAAVLALAGALCHSRLEQLVLEDCAVGSAGAAALFEALCHNRSLWKLDLSRNHVSDSACDALGQALLANRQLVVLSLAENDVSDRGVTSYLAPALAAAPESRLQQLVLRRNARISLLGRASLQSAVESSNASRMLVSLHSELLTVPPRLRECSSAVLLREKLASPQRVVSELLESSLAE
ncbi:hypothetical protein PybrP1_007030 [[Pythium] brassicae (nom. inval.)]|nr:hypothetical protein PybrP1_007030 [[Pythium] brassicae (nom. inval.)]